MDNQEFIEILLNDGLDDSTIIDFVETQNSEIVELREKLAAMESQAKQLITKACCNAVEKLTELAPNQGWDSGEVVAEMYIRQLSDKPVLADKPASAQEKADLIMGFVNQIAAAYESGFTPYPHMTLQQLHRVAQHHVNDELGIDTDDFEKAFGAELFAECRAISQGWGKPAVAVPDEMTSDRAKDFIVADDEKELLRFVQGFNCCRDSFMSVRPSHSQQSAEVDNYEELRLAAYDVLSWIEAKHRPPVDDMCGGMALVRLHALDRLHKAFMSRDSDRCPSHESEQLEPTKNQCDGCSVGDPINDDGNHVSAQNGPYMGCQKIRYDSPTPDSEGE